jgi:dipeptidyl aminopeptidase/acylaminoacyl peptidase
MRTMKAWLVIATWAVVLAVTGVAQQPAANTEVYVARLGLAPGATTAGAVTNISNSPGYDNQPSFTPDGKAVLFVSNRDGGQTDIFRYDLAAATLEPLTRTPESEYSPLVTPDGKTFSVIRVEADNTQRLWRFNLDGTNPRLVLENVKPVGYHVWIDATHLALFVLGGRGEPSTLQLADTKTGTAEVIDTNIGRSLRIRPGTKTLGFVSKKTTPWTIEEFDPKTRAIRPIVPATLPLSPSVPAGAGTEDFTWDPSARDGQVLVGQGAAVWAYWPLRRDGSGWAKLADFSSAGLDRITRLAVSADGKWLAFVAEPVAK